MRRFAMNEGPEGGRSNTEVVDCGNVRATQPRWSGLFAFSAGSFFGMPIPYNEKN